MAGYFKDYLKWLEMCLLCHVLVLGLNVNSVKDDELLLGHSQLHPDTIQRCMMYKDYLSRMHSPLAMWTGSEEEKEELQKEMDLYFVPLEWEHDWWNDKLYGC